MPTIDEAIKINLKDATGALPSETYGAIIVIGEHTDNTKYNDPTKYYSQTEVVSDFGAGSDIVKTTAKIFAQGVAHVTVVNVYKEVATPTDYDTVLAALESEQVDYDLMLGTIDADDANMEAKLVPHANTYKKLLVIPALDIKDNVITDFGALTANEFIYPIAHNDSAGIAAGELAGATAGVIGLLNPWIPPEWVSISGIDASEYTASEIVALEAAHINTVIKIVSAELSGALSLKDGKFIDIARTKIYLSTEIKNTLVNLKYRLANMGNKIPYSPAGLGMIKAAIEQVLRTAQTLGALREDYIDSNGDLQKGFNVQVPAYEDILESDKSSRILKNIVVTTYLSGAISKIELDLIITL